MKPSLNAPNFFAGDYIDRLAERRRDEAWLKERLSSGTVRLVPLWQGKNLISRDAPQPAALLLERGGVLADLPDEDFIFLGEFRGELCFAVNFGGADAPVLHDAGEFLELRHVSGQLHRDDAGLLGYARALILWRDRHRFCGRCGAATLAVHGGHALKCSNPSCVDLQFPRLDPAIIVLITDGERALLGRQAAWPAERYSTIAGYIEAGESLEEAVVREVREETGVELESVHYHSSQPWPFPASLMLGFIAHARTTDIRRNDRELEDARWFSRADLLAGACMLPPLQAVSFRLIEAWYDEDAERPLREEPRVRVASFAQRS